MDEDYLDDLEESDILDEEFPDKDDYLLKDSQESLSEINKWIKETLLIEGGWKQLENKISDGFAIYPVLKLDNDNLILTYHSNSITDNILQYLKFICNNASIKLTIDHLPGRIIVSLHE